MSHCWVDIDLDALRHNLRVLRQPLSPTTEVIAMVKGNAYGHGAAPCAQAALEAGASRLGVATLTEGVELRKAGLKAPVLVLGGFDASEADAYFVYDLTPVVGDAEAVRDLEVRARRFSQELPVHLHVDTGMGRLGIAPKKAGFLASNILRSSHLHLQGTSTHLATADEEDVTFVQVQVRRFRDALDKLQAEGIPPGLLHVANTAATLRFPETLGYQAVRPGLGLYGMVPSPVCEAAGGDALAPVMQWRSRLVRVERVAAGAFVSYGRTWRAPRDTVVGTVSAGYGDGYSRQLSNTGQVLVGGRRAPIVGRVTMDHFMVDLGPRPADKVGAAVTLLGRDGDQEIRAEEIAEWTGGICYEVSTAVAPRVERRFHGAREQVPARPVRVVA